MKYDRLKGPAALLIAVVMIMSLPCAAYAQGADARYVVTVYNEQNGLPTSEANVVRQTSDGYIWIGSYGGLIRYDGTTFRNYSLEGSIASSSIRSLFEDSKGRLWIGSNDAGVFLYENGVFSEIKCSVENTFLCIRDFVESSDGTIYAASNSGVGRITDNGVIPFETEGVFGDTVYSIAIDTHNRIWAVDTSGGCLLLDGDGSILREIRPDEVGLDSDIYCVANGPKGEIYLGSLGSALSKAEFPNNSTKPADFSITTYFTGGVSTANQISIADNGDILVSGLSGYGIISADGGFTEFGEEDNAASVNCSVRDYEGSYWLASSSYGIIKYTVGCFGTPNDKTGLGETSLNAVAMQDGSCYAGLDTGLMIFDSEWNAVTNELTEMLSGVRVRGLLADSSGKVWVAVYSDYAVLCYDPADGSIVTYGESNGFISNRGRTLIELSDGTVAAGTQHGVALIKDGKVIASYGAEDGLDNPYILSLLEGEDGTLYAGSDGNGIYGIKDGRVTNHSFSEGLGEGVVLRMLNNSDGGGVFISAGSSLYYWENGEFRKLDNFERGAGSFFDFYDRDGKLWLMQNSGIIEIDKEKLLSGKAADSVLYSFRHGLTGSLNANTWNYLDEDGTLYIATRQGISTFEFHGVENTLPKGIINSVTIDGEVYDHPEALTVPKDAGRITIDFAALTYTDTTRLGIAYYLEGFDSRETVLTGEKSLSVSYTNLSGGDYTFKVRIYDPENVSQSYTVQLPITKARSLDEEPLFRIVLVAVIVAAAVGIVLMAAKVKMDGMSRRSEEYRNMVNQSLRTFAKTIDAKDKYTNGHSIRVAEYSREIARRMKMNEQEQERIYYVALLHDIGKIGVPDHILNKPGALTEEERQVIQTHPAIGGEILKDFNALSGITDGAKYHHERYDGKGYCVRRRGEQIPLVARIIGVADTYDAMSSDRCYRKALSKEVIVEEFKKGTGTQFDPMIVPYMLEMIEDGTVPYDIER